jgi:hypothetical protein
MVSLYEDLKFGLEPSRIRPLKGARFIVSLEAVFDRMSINHTRDSMVEEYRSNKVLDMVVNGLSSVAYEFDRHVSAWFDFSRGDDLTQLLGAYNTCLFTYHPSSDSGSFGFKEYALPEFMNRAEYVDSCIRKMMVN